MCVHTAEYYLALKRDKVLIHGVACTNLEKFVLRKTLATKDHIFYDCLDVDCPNQADQETEADWWFPGPRAEGSMVVRSLPNGLDFRHILPLTS